MFWLGLLRLAGVVAGLATVYALARRWPRAVRVVVGALALAGLGLLGWAMAEGVWAEPGRIHYGSAGAEWAFLVGFPLASFGTAVFLIGLVPPHPRWGVGSTKAAVADVGVRVAATWVGGGILGVVLYTLVTGYVK